MLCYLCQSEAVGRCFNCGELICAQHGRENCVSCESGIVAGDPRPKHVSARIMSVARKNAWWRPQDAEGYQPPACCVCKGLARRRCSNCQDLFCPEHAG